MICILVSFGRAVSGVQSAQARRAIIALALESKLEQAGMRDPELLHNNMLYVCCKSLFFFFLPSPFFTIIAQPPAAP